MGLLSSLDALPGALGYGQRIAVWQTCVLVSGLLLFKSAPLGQAEALLNRMPGIWVLAGHPSHKPSLAPSPLQAAAAATWRQPNAGGAAGRCP